MASLPPPTLGGSTTVKFTSKDFVAHRKGDLLNNYDMGDMLGSGGYGEVYVGRHKSSGQERAIKIVVKDEDPEMNKEHINEFNVVKNMDHPNILKMYEFFENPGNYYFITDIYRGGELFTEIEKCGYFSEEDTAALMGHILSCINYCHKRNIVHRDLKPENILLEQNMKLDDIKIIDFGLAADFVGEPLTEGVGSSYYMSPQVILQSYGMKCDIWSCGVIAYITLAGYAPFDGEDDEEIQERILLGEYDFEDEVWDGVSELAMDFIQSLLTFDEDQRPSAEEALEHEWLSSFKTESETELENGRFAMGNLLSFNADSKLTQASYVIIASQLLEKGEKEIIDEVWRALDTNQDGKLDEFELKDGFKKFCSMTMSKQEVQELLKRIDIANTGFIEYSEFAVASMDKQDLLDDKRLVAVFNALDLDRDGLITIPDIVKVLGSVDNQDEQTLHDYVVNKVMKQVDPSGQTESLSFACYKRFMLTNQGPPVEPVKQPVITTKAEGGRKDTKSRPTTKARIARKNTNLPKHTAKRGTIAITGSNVGGRDESTNDLETIREMMGGVSMKGVVEHPSTVVRASEGDLMDDDDDDDFLE